MAGGFREQPGEDPARAEPRVSPAGSPAGGAAPGDPHAGGRRAGEEAAGMAEACRRFPLPSEEEARHALRELGWGEHLVVGRMVQSKGGSDLYLYSLKSAAVFLLDEDRLGIAKGDDRVLKLVDIDEFVSWVRDDVGDSALAAALEEACPADEPYADRLESLQMLVALRMVQYGGCE